MLRDEQKRFLTITEVAAKYDISLRTLRFYEERRLLAPLRQGLLRLYDAQEEVKLKVIRKGKSLGFSLDEIEKLLFDGRATRTNSEQSLATDTYQSFAERLTVDQIEDQITNLERKRKDISEAIDNLTRALKES